MYIKSPKLESTDSNSYNCTTLNSPWDNCSLFYIVLNLQRNESWTIDISFGGFQRLGAACLALSNAFKEI